MNKPSKKVRAPIYDYHECMKYLEHKYKFDADDFAGKWKGGEENLRKPFRSFWHWVLDRQSVTNGGKVYFSKEDLELEYSEKELFAKQVVEWILAEYLEPGEEYVVMLVEW